MCTIVYNNEHITVQLLKLSKKLGLVGLLVERLFKNHVEHDGEYCLHVILSDQLFYDMQLSPLTYLRHK